MAVPARLVIQDSNGAAQVIQLKKGLNRLGRSAANDFVIVDPSVSRLHCEIEVRDDGMFVRDLDSSNGTFVDGQPVSRAQLHPGQTLQLGSVRMIVEQAPEPVCEPPKWCYNHPEHPASMRCKQCGKIFCGSCVHVLRRVGGKYLRLCPVCSGHCEPMVVVKPPPKKLITGFLRKLMGKTTDERPFFE
ncbi:MAG: FHA domain-containing protein [Verrucomicrobiae bacterium]|nr:FHA domain-containing protein [Verrucomicrobiae bacterium]